MKKIGKLSINPEKMIKDNELVSLKGGYGGPECCYCGTWPEQAIPSYDDDFDGCTMACESEYGVGEAWKCY